MKLRDMIASVVIIGITIMIVSLIFIQMNTGDGCGCGPAMTVKRVNSSTIAVTLMDMGGYSSLEGLYIASPAIANPEVIPRNVELELGKAIVITDPKLAIPTHLIVTTWSSNRNFELLDTEV